MLSKRRKYLAISLTAVLVLQVVAPCTLHALTTGPAQPEFSGFSAVGSSDMVNLFSGDLNYSIPLLELPGPGGSYPFTLSYQSGITMDQEASWVGLGWSLNAGAITREMRGLPDEYKGDSVTTTNDMKPNVTWDFGIGPDLELLANPMDDPGNPDTSFGKISIGLNLSHNTYKGWDAGFSLGLKVSPLNMKGFGFSGGLTTSASEGADLSAGFSFAIKACDVTNSYSLGTSINSREGLTDLNLGYSHSNKLTQKTNFDYGSSAGYNLSFERRSFIPANEVRYKGATFNGSVEIGALLAIPHLGGRVRVGYSRQEIDRRNEPIGYQGFGYLHSKMRNVANTFLMDINRMSEGPIHKFTRNLAIPATTPDLFTVSGAGLNAKFRAFRSDVGIYSDPYISSSYTSANLGFDINPTAIVDVGVNGGAQHARSSNVFWPTFGKNIDHFNFNSDTINSPYRPAYFKIPGEPSFDSLSTHNYISGDHTVRIGMDGSDIESNTKLEKENQTSIPINQGNRTSREPQSKSIQYVTNKELNASFGLTRPEYQVWIHNPDRSTLNRSQDSLHHIAGFEIINEDGLRYIYALPVKNKEHREYIFSVAAPLNQCTNEIDVNAPSNNIIYQIDSTDEYYQEKELSPYAHSHLLTAVLGSDYADIDDIVGPSENDLGFWVRFEYEKTPDYSWRAPYQEANYIQGNPISTRDDKASFLYGVREQYYLKFAETRTHHAEFVMTTRDDARGAGTELNGTGTHNGESKRLSEIRLYSKLDQPYQEAKALKRIRFGHSYALCQGVPNAQAGMGKLTLDTLYFSYEKSVEGYFTPYIFEYTNNEPYNTRNQDRWGRYQELTNECLGQEFPYTVQDSAQANQNAQSWHLNKVTLPSGAEITIGYESDDYLHVQDREVMQMFPITQVSTTGNTSQISDPKAGPFKVYFNPGTNDIDSPSDLIPYFNSIHGLILDNEGNIINKNESQVYFKVRMLIRDGRFDYISGYAKIKSFGLDGDLPYVELESYKLGNQEYHPFCAAAWQKIKLEYPSIVSFAEFEDNDQSFKEVIGLLGASFWELKDIFTRFFTTCYNQRHATTIDPDFSFIRLSYPGSGKYGGDSRVSRITLDDHWGGPVTLGQTFEYTMMDSTGRMISSGVAENEPAIGYEECPLRFAKMYDKEIPVHTSENLMFEYPINDAYLPASNIGYRQVTVRSLATKLKKDNAAGLPDNFSTTGRTVHEFYTSKDFPIIFGETTIEKRDPTTPLWNTLFSVIQKQIYAGSQGYSIILNDMHGKPFRVTHYGEDKMNREQETIITKTEYTYNEGPLAVKYELGKFKTFRTLENEVMALMEYAPHPTEVNKMDFQAVELGVDREFFTDLRVMSTVGKSINTGPNLICSIIISILGIPIPMPGYFVSVSKTENTTKTAVANKIITKTGILKQIDVYDGQSHLRTNNLVFDKMTGQPILTSVNNAFDEKIYALNIPAHYNYKGMDAAYQNYRLPFTAQIDDNDNCTGWYFLENVSDTIEAYLMEDDELVLLQNDTVKGTFIIQEINGDSIYGSSIQELEFGDYQCLLLRSGARNMLTQGSFNLSAIINPLTNVFVEDVYEFNIPTPGGDEETTFIPIYFDSIISTQAVTYGRIVSPIQLESYCACVSATIQCDGGCAGRVYLAYLDAMGDTIVLSETECFDCEIENPNPITLNFECSDYLETWELFSYILPIEDSCAQTQYFNECIGEIVSLNIEFGSCGSRPGLEMSPMGNRESVISNAGGNHWVPKSKYLFTSPRNITSLDTAIDLKLSKEGLISELPLFNFQNPFFVSSEVGEKWIESEYKLVGESFSNIESSENAIRIPSTLFKGYSHEEYDALYGNSIIISAENALPSELGFEGFEEKYWSNGPPPYYLSSGNFTLGVVVPQNLREEKYRLLGGILGTPSDLVIAKQFDENDPLPFSITLDLKNEFGFDSRHLILEVTDQIDVLVSDYEEKIKLPYDTATVYSVNWLTTCLPLAALHAGEATLVFKQDNFNQIWSGIQNVEFAHTGIASFSAQTAILLSKPQTSLNLIRGKEYVFEGWIRLLDNSVASYPSEWYVQIVDGAETYHAIPRGQIIEGWQQIQCIFTASGGPINFIFKKTPQTFFDDIRISPLDAKIKTYVYDPNSLKLIAELDENNYATFYSYDDEGKLVLVRKETERGIMTIQESRSHLHPHQ